jgi:hypothetical protein
LILKANQVLARSIELVGPHVKTRVDSKYHHVDIYKKN